MSAASSNVQPSGAPLESVPPAAAATGKESYGQILKSSVLVGGSSVISIGIGILRTKAMATLLGTAGFGLMGLYTSIQTFALSIAGMGINSSGVRQIAEAVGTGDTRRIARTVAVLRRTAIFLGLAGAVFLVAFCQPVAKWTFGSEGQPAAVALLSLAVFLKLVSDGQGALIQGMRRIADLAWMSVLGVVCGAVASIVLVYFYRERGVVPALIAMAGMSLLLSWWYSRKIKIQTPSISIGEVRQEAAALLKLGFAFMASGMMIMGSALAVRVILRDQISLEAAGLYNSAWTLGGMYVGIILQAMGADFYPRLTGAIHNPAESNRLVNEQAQISMLLAGPGVLATLTFAPVVIWLFYTSAFEPAVGILRWICLGAMLQVVTWPMGFIIVAKGRQSIFFWCELAYAAAHLALAWVGVKYWGLAGAGIAFFGSYVFHGFLIYPVVRRMTGFRWSTANLQIGLWLLPLIGLVFTGFHFLPLWAALTVGTLATLFSSIYSMSLLCRLFSPASLPGPLRRVVQWFGSDNFLGFKRRS